MDTISNIGWWLAAALGAVIFFCGIYMLATGKVLLSYITIGAGRFTEESKRAFSKLGGLAIVIGLPGVALVKLGADVFSNMPVAIIGIVMAIVAIILYFMARKKLVRE